MAEPDVKIIEGKEEPTVVIEDPKPKESGDTGVTMTEAEMKAADFSPDEIAEAKKHGQVKEEPAAKTPEEKKTEEAAAKQKEKDAGKTQEDKDAETEAAKAELDIIDKKPIETLTPAEEKIKLEKYNANEKALYFKQKKERKKRQEVENEVKLLKIKQKEQAEEIEKLKKGEGAESEKEDPDRPITAADLKKREEEKTKEDEKKAAEEKDKRAAADRRLEDIKTEARTRYNDFDDVWEKAKVVLDTQFETSARVRVLNAALIEALASGDDDSDYNAADIAYDIGKLHPDYKPSGTKKDDGKEGGTPEEKARVAKILANKKKQIPSAAIGGLGSGRTTVPESDLTAEQAGRLPEAEYRKLKPETRERIEREISART